jgi:hypothetical protein
MNLDFDALGPFVGTQIWQVALVVSVVRIVGRRLFRKVLRCLILHPR